MRGVRRRNSGRRTGGAAVVKELEKHGIRHVFGVPGESFLDFLDAVRGSKVRFVNCRQEGGAAMCAEATGKATGRAGVAYVTRAPGAANAAAGVYIAGHDCSPMVLLVGQVESRFRGRDAFQEIDCEGFFGGFAKKVYEIGRPDDIGAGVADALATAESGSPGPVVVSIPEDLLAAETDRPVRRRRPERYVAADSEILDVSRRLEAAERPMIIVGGSPWTPEASGKLAEVAERAGAPVAATFRRMALIDALHPCYAGDLGLGPNPELVRLVRESDLLLVVGDKLSEVPSQSYTLLEVPDPAQPLIHVLASPRDLGKMYKPALGILSDPYAFLAPLAELLGGGKTELPRRVRAAHASYLQWSGLPPAGEGTMNDECIRWLRDNLPEDAVIANGAGNYCAWINRHYRFRRPGSLLGPVSGTMGYGLPAAIAQKLAAPSRTVVCMAGDGCLQMTIQELGTAVQERLAFPVVVFDNACYGTIRMHQERRYPGRRSGTDLSNPDFGAVARAYGCEACTVTESGAFGSAMERALASDRPFLVHVMSEPDVLVPAGSRF